MAVGRLQPHLRQLDDTILHGHRAREFRYLHAAPLLLQSNVTDVEPQRGVVVVDVVYTYLDSCQVKMIVVQSGHAGLIVLVVLQGTVAPVGTLHGIGLAAQVYQRLACHQFTKVGSDTHRVTGHVQRHIGAHHHHAVSHDFPEGFRRGGVLRNGVVELDVQTAILQAGTVQLHSLFVEVDAAALDRQASEGALYTGGIHKAVGIECRIHDLQFVDDHLLLQQWPELNIDHQLLHIGNGVTLMYHHDVING